MNLNETVRKLGFANYTAYLNGPWWQEFRALYAKSKLPKKCVACGYPDYILHHLNYNNIGMESFLDVIPVCHRCHTVLHETQEKLGLDSSRPDLTLKRIFRWSQNETDAKFQEFHKMWNRASKTDGVQFKRNPKKPKDDGSRDSNDYYKLSRDLRNFQQYVRDGYTQEQIAKMYKVNVRYVKEFMEKFPDYFEVPSSHA